MKRELLQRYAEALKIEDFKTLKKEVNEIRKAYVSESERVEAERKKEYLAKGEEAMFYSPVKDGEDKEYDVFETNFRQLVKEQEEKEAAERAESIANRTQLIADLQELVKAGDPLGEAFNKYNAIHDKWKAQKHVAGPEGQDLNKDFHHNVDVFFYTVDMTKQMREMDYEKNLVEKKVLIEKIPAVRAVEDIKEREKQLRKLQSDFNSIGPVPFAVKDEVTQTFRTGAQEIYDSIQAFYDERRVELDAKLKEKIAACEEVKALCETYPDSTSGWNTSTDKIIALQKSWGAIGFSSENETIWRVFRSICDQFFNAKREYYNGINEVRDRNADLKRDLISKAEAVKTDTNWKQTSAYLIDLQKSWKEVGSARRGDEQKLWKSFREACNTFFDAKKLHFEGQAGEQKANLELKNALIEKINTLQLSGNTEQDFATLKEMSNEWSGIGFVPMKAKDKTYKAYHTALDSKYDELKVSRDQRMTIQFENRLQNMQSSGNAGAQINDEKRNIRSKIQNIETDIRTYENNMGFFGKSNKSNKPNPLIKEIEQKIKKLRGEASELKKKLYLVQKAEKPKQEAPKQEEQKSQQDEPKLEQGEQKPDQEGQKAEQDEPRAE